MRHAVKGLGVWGFIFITSFVVFFLLVHQPRIKAQESGSAPEVSSVTEAEQGDPEQRQPLAFDYLPKTKMGYVDWVAAITEGAIEPLESLDPNEITMKALDFDIVFEVGVSGLPDVVYPHYPHTLWLDCRNCHPGIFLMQAGANDVTMAKILQGEFCGRCHGTVAFPISDCFRCHSRPK